MRAQVKKTKENKSNAVIDSAAQKQRSGESAFDFMDNRAMAVSQRKLQAMITGNPTSVIQKYSLIRVNQNVHQEVDNGGGPVDYDWNARFTMRIPTKKKDEQIISCRIRLNTNATNDEVAAWNVLTQKVWNDKFGIKYQDKVYPIRVSLEKAKKSKAHHTVDAVRTRIASPGGGFGTENMGEWGTNDTSEVPHEVGHMLGNVDEYGQVTSNGDTVNHGDYDRPDLTYGSEGQSLMHNTNSPVRRRNFEMIHTHVQGQWHGCTLVKIM